MNLSNFGSEELEKGILNGMLRQGGVNDVDSFVEQFRDEAKRETAAQHYTDNQYDEDTSCRTASD